MKRQERARESGLERPDEPGRRSEQVADRAFPRFLKIAGKALFGAALVYALGVCTRWGQHFGDAAYAGRLQSSPELRRGALEVLETLRGSSIVLIGGAALLVALVRGRPRLALLTAAVLAVSILGGEALKRALVRPDYGIDPAGMTGNWAPSGHATVAMTLVLCVLLVVPDRLRVSVAIVGATYAALVASGTLAAGWHRPADAIMASLWSFGIATLGVAVLVAWRGGGSADAVTQVIDGRHLQRAGIAVVVTIPVLVVIGSFFRDHESILWAQPSWRFVVAIVVIDLVAVASVVIFARLLRGIPLDRPRSPQAILNSAG